MPYTQDPYFGIPIPAYVIAPNRARPSAGGTVLTTHLNWSSRKVPWLLVNSKYLCWTDYKFKMANNNCINVVTLGVTKIICWFIANRGAVSISILLTVWDATCIIKNYFTILGHQQLDYKVRHIFLHVVMISRILMLCRFGTIWKITTCKIFWYSNRYQINSSKMGDIFVSKQDSIDSIIWTDAGLSLIIYKLGPFCLDPNDVNGLYS